MVHRKTAQFPRALTISLTLFALLFATLSKAEVARFSPFDDRTVATAGDLLAQEALPKSGGVLRLGALGGFDSLNLMKFPGNYPITAWHAHDSLLRSSQTEKEAYYGLLAKKFEVSEDFSELYVELDPAARWHDGSPVTAGDIVFTFAATLENASPDLRSALGQIDIVAESDSTVRFRSQNPGDWRWIRLVGAAPIYSAKDWAGRDPSATTLEPSLGSGPYTVSRVDGNRIFEVQRAPDYWAADHPLNAHLWHFDTIRMDYFFDVSALTQAVRRGDIDLHQETDATRWREAYDSPALREGKLVQSALPAQTFVRLPVVIFNLRRPLTRNLSIRRALAVMIDTDWLYDLNGGSYARADSLYGDLRMAAQGKVSAAETELLVDFANELPQGFFDQEAPVPSPGGLSNRERRQRASDILDKAGFALRDGRRIDPATDQPVTLDVVSQGSDTVPLLQIYAGWLDSIGITLKVVTLDPSSTTQMIFQDANFDLLLSRWTAADLPGQFENFLWHSRYANAGLGLAGLKSPVADHLIDTMNTSLNEEKIIAAARAFDRYLRWNAYTVPLWQQNEAWFIHSANLAPPIEPIDPTLQPARTWRLIE
ncbi:MAG: ABC transporter substrate-binding protein [Pseudomonadota bacterium]